MKNIITIQHTQSIHHTNGMVGSWTDWDLTESGIVQAEKIGKRLAVELSGKLFTMYTSDLLRTRHTADIVAKHLSVTPTPIKALRERNLGIAVGKSVAWLKEHMECIEKTIDDRMFSDAESQRDVYNRLVPLLDALLSDPSENIILVSHGGTLSVFNILWLGLPADALDHMDLYGLPGGVSFMKEDITGKRIIRRLSDLSYIK